MKSRSSSSARPPSYEDKLLGYNGKPGMISKGSLTDKDINFIMDSGDKRLINALERKYEREKKNSEHVQRVHGSAFTNKDNDGNLYKDTDISKPVIDPESTKKDVKRMEKILKENL